SSLTSFRHGAEKVSKSISNLVKHRHGMPGPRGATSRMAMAYREGTLEWRAKSGQRAHDYPRGSPWALLKCRDERRLF
ncbi:MAG: hypothetical protein VX342_08610, partial [Pseudomonadota bacterium]|nr:hypothetical protein [Pseudomonadota bacterium]